MEEAGAAEAGGHLDECCPLGPGGSSACRRGAAEAGGRLDEYWRRNLRWVAGLLAVWFLVSYGFGIVLAEPLNQVRIRGTGFPLGFWFAQQGAIYVFVALIFVYARVMNRLDREFGLSEE